MKHSNDDILQTNLLQAFQKNKLIQGKLNERQRLYYVQLTKDMQDYKLKEKLNKELLYTWKKENYVRQLKTNLREYERKRFGVRDAYYEYQLRNLDCVINGQQGLAIPPKEEERRLNVNAKFNQFLKEHPLQTTSSIHVVQSTNIPIDQIKRQQEEEDARNVEETWKHIHAQSALGLKRKQRSILPSIQRSLTMDEIRRNEPSTKILVPPTVAIVSNPSVTTSPEVVNVSSETKHQPPAVAIVQSIRSTMSEDVEPIKITSDILDRETRADLVAMRSVRRPQKNPIDLNVIFESRKRIYQINKRVYDYQLCQRKCSLRHNSQFDREEKIDPADDDQNLLVEMSETTRRRYEDRHQADKNFV
jgi:hypothetical protein